MGSPGKRICLDASFLIPCVVAEDHSDSALAILERWAAARAVLLAPSFMIWEVGSVLRRKVAQGVLLAEQGRAALDLVLDLPVTSVDGGAVAAAAWRIAERFDLPVLYDAAYLAVAEVEGAEFWTADAELVRRVGRALQYVRLLGRDSAEDAERG